MKASSTTRPPSGISAFESAGLPRVSVVLPCLNEARTIVDCITAIQRVLEPGTFEIVVADNGSTDDSAILAIEAGARVVPIPRRGYGSAILGGIAAARAPFVIMADADMTYDFACIPEFVNRLEEGFDLVVGNRFKGGIAPGAMPPLHRYLGNPVLSTIGRVFFGTGLGDFHCGIRGFRKSAIDELGLTCPGMEFASEMILRAALANLEITEVPSSLRPSPVPRVPHLKTWSDGWRHLELLLQFCPRWLFTLPGLSLIAFGFCLMVALLPGPLQIGSVRLDVHSLVYATVFQTIGLQLLSLGVVHRQVLAWRGIVPFPPALSVAAFHLITAGLLLILLGLGGSLWAVGQWSTTDFRSMDPIESLRLVVPSSLAISSGAQLIVLYFLLGAVRRDRD